MRWILGFAVLLRVALLFSPVVSDDVHRYVWEGRIQPAGVNPYAVAPSDPALAPLRTPTHAAINHPDLPSIYPPLAQAAFVGATAAGLEEVGWKNVMVVLDLVLVGLLVSWLSRTGRDPRAVAFYALAPPALIAAGTGHLEPLLLLPLAAFAWAAERRAWSWAALWLALGILAKLVPVLLLPWLFVRRPRAVLTITLPLVLLAYLPYLLGGAALGSLVAFGRDFAYNASLFRVADAVLPAGAARPLLGGVLVAFCLFLAYAEPRPARAVAFAMATLLLLSPTVHPWYLTWFLVVVPAVEPRRVALPLIVWSVTILFALPVHVRSHLGAPFEEAFGWTVAQYVPVGIALAWVLWRARPVRARLAGIGAAAPAPGPGSFAVVIPARGERDNLEGLLPAWLATPAREVIVADTPSGDGTEALAATHPRVCYVAVPERGYGAAVAAGWKAAAPTDFLVIADADYEPGPAHVVRLLAPLDDPTVGLVTGARRGPGLSWPQRWGNRLATALLAAFWGRRFEDLGPFRALRRAALPPDAIEDHRFGWNVEMNVRALQRGLEVVEVPVPVGRRAHGQDRISATVRGVLAAGRGILGCIHRLREEACPRPS